jgi:alkanesulfonate monooxygenase SsuD/methylene tetrahydromethanopterin reductase-like flavin-dependent oxidoreductase (luciferase family)
MRAHTQAGSPQAERLTAEFADGFAVLGPADRCIARLQELTAIGLDHVVIVGPSLGADPAEARAAHQRFVAEVLPALHET